MDAPAARAGDAPLAMICGGGSLPFAVADAVERRGRRVVLFALEGFADPVAVSRFPHHWVKLAQMGRFRRLALGEGCGEIMLIGNVVRPPLRRLRMDWLTLRLLPKAIRMYRGGDNHLLSGLARIVEELGFRLISPQEVAPEILAGAGTIGKREPSARDRLDIARGLALIRTMGPFDIGQAVVVAHNRVLAVEAAEGTDLMLERIATLRRAGRLGVAGQAGVLVKGPKPGQDFRMDLPSIGPHTVAGVAQAGLAGLAVVAGQSIIAEPAQVAQAADAAGIFVVGEQPGEPPP